MINLWEVSFCFNGSPQYCKSPWIIVNVYLFISLGFMNFELAGCLVCGN